MSTANMALDLPTPGVGTDQAGEQKILDALTAVDAHDHTSGMGVKVPVGLGLNWASAIVTKATSYTIQNDDGYRTILVDCTSTGRTITLPQAGGNTGRELVIKAKTASSNNVSVAPPIAGTIDGSSSPVTFNNYGVRRFISDGTAWWVV